MMNTDGNREISQEWDLIRSRINTTADPSHDTNMRPAPFGMRPLASNQSAAQANTVQSNVTNWPSAGNYGSTNVNLPQQAFTTQTPADTYPTTNANIPAYGLPPSQPAIYQSTPNTNPLQPTGTNNPYAGQNAPTGISPAHATYLAYHFPLTYFNPDDEFPPPSYLYNPRAMNALASTASNVPRTQPTVHPPAAGYPVSNPWPRSTSPIVGGLSTTQANRTPLVQRNVPIAPRVEKPGVPPDKGI